MGCSGMGGVEVLAVEELDKEYMAEYVSIVICGDIVRFSMNGDYDAYNADVSRSEAIAAAKAILQYYGEL